jgi:hypothetical protein
MSTPFEYLMPSTEVPVTIGCCVLCCGFIFILVFGIGNSEKLETRVLGRLTKIIQENV